MKTVLPTFIISFGLFIITFNTVNAQEDEPLLNFGLKSGLNYSWLNLEDTDDETGKIGFHAGILTRINISEYFALQGEALYSTKGTKVKYDNLFFNGEATLRINYLEVPILLVAKLNQNFNIYAGPYLGFTLSANAKNDSSVNLFDFEEEVDRDNFKDTDYGISAGIGIEAGHVLGGLRYNHGLNKIEQEKEFNGNNYTFSEAKNSVLQLYIGFKF